MSWGKLDDRTANHPKVRRALAECPEAVAIWFLSIANAAGFRESAEVPGEVPDWFIASAVPTPKRRQKVADVLVAQRLWDEDPQGRPGWFLVHDFEQHNPLRDELEQRRAADRERQAALRARKRLEGDRAA